MFIAALFIKLKTKNNLMSFNNKIVKQTVVHPYHGTLSSNNKKQTVGTCKSVDEPKRNYAKGKKSILKDCILHDSI